MTSYFAIACADITTKMMTVFGTLGGLQRLSYDVLEAKLLHLALD